MASGLSILRPGRRGARGAGRRHGARVHEQRTALAETLADHLHECAALLIDNCEHLVGACAGLAAALLQECPALHILATAANRWACRANWFGAYPRSRCRKPSPGTIQPARSGRWPCTSRRRRCAVCSRATTAAPGLRAVVENGAWVAEICRQLDGMPLAIELARTHVRALSVRGIAQRLNDPGCSPAAAAPPASKRWPPRSTGATGLLSQPEHAVSETARGVLGGCTLAVCCR